MQKSVLAALLTWLVLGAGVRAGDFPSHPITIVVPFSAGGAADTSARAYAVQLTAILGQNVIVENRTGGRQAIPVRSFNPFVAVAAQ